MFRSRRIREDYLKVMLLALILAVSLAPVLAGPTAYALKSPTGCQYTIEYKGVVNDYTEGQSTWYYEVCSVGDPAISHTVFVFDCWDEVVDAGTWNDFDDLDPWDECGSEPCWEAGKDGSTGLWGLKFEEGFENECRNYYFTLDAIYAPDQIDYAIKAGGSLCTGSVTGPNCKCPLFTLVSMAELLTDPPEFELRDEFYPCEWVYVWGYGFEFCQWYEIYIQPYIEGSSVEEGQKLDHNLSAPLGYPDPTIGPVIVHIDKNGEFEGGPVALFHATEDMICTYWEIVADKIGDGHQAGVYNACEDGLDAIALDEPGFHIVPEALTIILLGAGLVGLGGYVGLRRRNGTETDA